MTSSNVYWDRDRMKIANVYPSVLAIGDSWFWYPFFGGSLINQLGRLVAGKGHAIFAIGNNGAEAFDYVYGKYRKSVKSALKLYGRDLSAVFISGGGNDFAGFNDLGPLLKADCTGITNAKDCFRKGNTEGTINWLMTKTGESYRILVGQILASTNPDTVIIMHNYDYAYPSGKGVFGNKSHWLKPALAASRVSASIQRDCIKYLIDRFTRTIMDVARADQNRILVVNSTSTLKKSDWANELHPKPSGFKKIARKKWLPVLRDQGLA
jgi:hypothetical protein